MGRLEFVAPCIILYDTRVLIISPIILMFYMYGEPQSQRSSHCVVALPAGFSFL